MLNGQHYQGDGKRVRVTSQSAGLIDVQDLDSGRNRVLPRGWFQKHFTLTKTA